MADIHKILSNSGPYVAKDGSLGIGTVNPSATLELNSTTGNAAKLRVGRQTTATNYLELGTDGGSSVINAIGIAGVNASLIFNRSTTTTTTESMRIDSSGFVQFSQGDGTIGGAASITHHTNNYLYIRGGSAGIVVGDDGSDSRMLVANNNFINWETQNTERMRITSSGNVGIGTTSPSQKAVISGPNTAPSLNTTAVSSASLLVSNSDTGYGTYFGTTGSGIGLIQQRRQTSATYYDLSLQPYGGDVGIGTLSPTCLFHVQGNPASTGVLGRFYGSSTLGSLIQFDRGSSYNWKAGIGGASSSTPIPSSYFGIAETTQGARLVIAHTTGNVGIGTATPAEKLHIIQNTSDHLTLKLEQDDASYECWFEANSQDGGFFRAGISNNSNNFAFFNTDQAAYRWYGAGGGSPGMVYTNGYLGIGVTSPSYKLHVEGNSYINATSSSACLTLGRHSGQPTIKAGTDDGGYLIMDSSGGRAALNWYSGDHVVLAQGGGNVGIKTVSPSTKLHISGNVAVNNTSTESLIRLERPFNSGVSFAQGADIAVGRGNTYPSTQMRFILDNGSNSTANPQSTIMALDSSGNVGIGTISPGYKLDISGVGAFGTGYRTYVHGNGNGSFIEFGTDADNDALGVLGTFASAMVFDTNQGLGFKWRYAGNDRMTLTTGGNLGIGTTSPGKKLHVVTTALFGPDGSTSRSTNGVGITFTNNNTFSANADITDANRYLAITNDSTTANAYAPLSFRVNPNGGSSNAMADIKLVSNGSAHHLTTTIKNPATGNFIDTISIAQNGNVGIGETSPSRRLHIKNTDDTRGILVENTLATSYAEVHVKASREFRIGTGNSSSATEARDRFYVYDATAAAHRFTIDSSGNVGISNTSPSEKLDVNGNIRLRTGVLSSNNGTISHSTNNLLYVFGGSSGLYLSDNTGQQNSILIHDTNYIDFQTAATRRLRIDSSGRMLVGLSGSGNIYVGGSTTGQYFRIHHNNSDTYLDGNGGKIYFRGDSGANTRFEMDMTGTNAGQFIAAGDVVAFGSPSDKTLKENIKPIENALDKINKLKGVEFNWKEQGITNLNEDIGFIAQDVQEVLPQLVRENENGKLSLRHQGIVPVLVEAIKELTKEIEILKTQINN